MKRISTDKDYLETGKVVIDADGIQVDMGGIGSKFINVDTDGTPYWVESGGTHFLLTDTLGPYFTATIARTITTDTDGTPVIG